MLCKCIIILRMLKRPAYLLLIATSAAFAVTGTLLPAAEKAPAPVQIRITGVHNAYRVTERILAGSQPEGDAAFDALAKAGVKTIISVDGSKPDIEAAKKHGLRYVHLPFGYDGIPANRIAELAKAAAPEAGTIFVHCHHGKHRGPAAVGVICEVSAGWSPAQADAWLKQAGTAADYPGLYRAVREFRAPTSEEIAHVGALPEAAKTPALVDAMVAIDERFDALKSAQASGWKTPSDKIDASPAHQATLLWEQLRELARTDDTAKRPDDFRKLLADSERAATALRDSLRTSPAESAARDRALKQTTQSCAACHKTYRNEKK
jgi:protein tyrosine phosphatase (PTP) superfamily phosphohydrolase (DUF442 family)